MYHMLLSFIASAMPLLLQTFVGLLVLFKVYIKVRAKFNANVNCWFCNQNTKVPYLDSNSWMCPNCEQYNGFTKDGDYNREIFQQHDCSKSLNNSLVHRLDYLDDSGPQNGFCNVCNEAQRLKIEKLAQFEPKLEFRFDDELKAYKLQLEKKYRLCNTCDRHLKKVLREKKKMVLGSKFLHFITKGAATLTQQQPHFKHLRKIQQQLWKNRLTFLINILALVNTFCLVVKLPLISQESLWSIFGVSFGEFLFIVQSHIWTLAHVIGAYLKMLTENELFIKLSLFAHTFLAMAFYSLGLKSPQIRLDFNSLFMVASPFTILILAFVRNLADGFRLSRFTVLLVLWSILTGGYLQEQNLISQNVLNILASVSTFLIGITNDAEPSLKMSNSNTNSFHKICSEDYLSDDDTISLLSQQLNCSDASSVHSAFFTPSTRSRNLRQSPRTSSLLSLAKNRVTPQQSRFLPNSSFKTFSNVDDMHSQNQLQMGNFGDVCMTRPTSTAQPHFDLSLDLSCRKRAASVFENYTKTANQTANLSFHSAQNVPFCTQLSEPNDLHLQKIAVEESTFAAAPLLSPCSTSTNSFYRPLRTPSLISPSRFSNNFIANNAAAGPWQSGVCLNQTQPNPNFNIQHAITTDDNISRTSSQSSGFESQVGRLNGSHENLVQQNMSLGGVRSSFEPIEFRYSTPTFGDSLPNLSVKRPLSVNCGSSLLGWRAKIKSQDSFNLRKINEELPTYKQGALLKKLQHSQAIS